MNNKDINEEQLTLNFDAEFVIAETTRSSSANSAQIIELFNKRQSGLDKNNRSDVISRILQQAEKYSW